MLKLLLLKRKKTHTVFFHFHDVFGGFYTQLETNLGWVSSTCGCWQTIIKPKKSVFLSKLTCKLGDSKVYKWTDWKLSKRFRNPLVDFLLLQFWSVEGFNAKWYYNILYICPKNPEPSKVAINWEPTCPPLRHTGSNQPFHCRVQWFKRGVSNVYLAFSWSQHRFLSEDLCDRKCANA